MISNKQQVTRRIKVYVDTKPLESEHAVRGVGAYTRNLLDALKEQKEIELVDKIKNCDVVHYPYFDLFFLTLPLSKRKPTVVTIHDAIPLIYPEQYSPGIRGLIKYQIQKFSLKGVAAVITDSETSKKDIVRFLDISANKIHVVHLASGEKFKKLEIGPPAGGWKLEIKKLYGLPDRFVLYVGDVNYNKNIPGLLRAFKLITNHNSPITKLVLVGDAFKREETPEVRQIFQLIKRLNLEDKVIMPGFVQTEDLVYFYNLATVYCQPSFYEGFGLPVLEAMACGCPVVAAKTQSIVEIAQNSALFVNPKDPKSMEEGLLKVISDKEMRDRLIKKGAGCIKEFSWEKTAKETIEVYRKVISE